MAVVVSDEHFSVDGTLIQAWASMKSFRPKDGSGDAPAPGRNGERDFHGEQRTNDSHASATDPEARLFRKGKGKEAKLCFMDHALMENRHGLLVDSRVGEANGTAEREVAGTMLAGVPGRHPITVGGDKNFDTAGFVTAMRKLRVTRHVAKNTTNRGSAIDGRTTRHPGYAVSTRTAGREDRRPWTHKRNAASANRAWSCRCSALAARRWASCSSR